MSNIVKWQEPASEPSAVREYSLGVLKGILGAVPYIGSLLNEVLFEARSRLKQQRIEAFFGELADGVNRLDENKIDREYLRSEEFSDLLEDVSFRVTQTRDERKREYFKTILLKGVCGERAPNFAALFTSLLHELTIEELKVFSGYAEGFEWLRDERSKGNEADMKPLDWTLDTIEGYTSVDYRRTLQSLIQKGMLFDNSFGRWDTKPYTFVEATDLGFTFYRWIHQ